MNRFVLKMIGHTPNPIRQVRPRDQHNNPSNT